METMVVVNSMTAHRANVIFAPTGSAAMGVVKAQMIDLSRRSFVMAWGYCPLSFRTVDSVDYKKAMLMFYEQNNIAAFKQIFIEQYEFATKNYF